MSLRFRRSVRLFPGVRLNFSGSGISTTVGVRGASLTLGPRGTHANVGLPGTGLSYRTRVGAPPGSSSARPPPTPSLVPPTAPLGGGVHLFGAVEISSADVSALTSAGLGELKRLINEAAMKRQQLTSTVARHLRDLEQATSRLGFARTFVIRIFTQKSIPALASAVASHQDELDDATAELAACFVEVDFAFDDATHATYAALGRAFEAAAGCQKIWDVTSYAATNQVAERTTASQSLTRTAVQFDFAVPDIVKTSERAMRLGEASGRPILLYPGLLMMRDQSSDFALVEYGDVEVGLRQSSFIEEETVPADTEVLGYTWKKANKDGSQDRRFADNYQIPIVRYAELTLRSGTGLNESWQFSRYDKAEALAQALNAHQRALQALARSPVEIEPPPPFEPDPDPEPQARAGGAGEAVAVEEPPSLTLDYIALVLLIVAVMLIGDWLIRHSGDAARPAPAPARAVVAAPTVEPKPKPKPKSALKKAKPSARAPTATTADAPPASSAGDDKADDIPY